MAKPTFGDIYSCRLDKERDDIEPQNGYQDRLKYIAVIGTPEYGYYVAYLIVNHDINENFIDTKELLDCQFPLKQEDYPDIFTKYEISYLDLSRIREMELDRLNDEATLVGHLTTKDESIVRESLLDSPVLSTKQLRRIGLIE